jgi:hypothetical protein
MDRIHPATASSEVTTHSVLQWVHSVANCMNTVVVSLIALAVAVSSEARVEHADRSLEVAVWNVRGSSGILTSGMRVDASTPRAQMGLPMCRSTSCTHYGTQK